ncbi:MAG: hypothetical protein A3K11_11765 [Nitrospirae bacterium RIFCSPLOWO2_12_FULL_63_8]|nr:MAG: hypothetical protein A3K11_11765 [Nitrospirae bacterium RIFCSPLOWO2_12_FULL_63_8]
MKTRFQISITRSPSPLGTASPGTDGPWSKWISEQGPQGPVSAICQKLSVSSQRTIRDAGTPIFSQSLNASSSSRNTVTQSRSLGRPTALVR